MEQDPRSKVLAAARDVLGRGERLALAVVAERAEVSRAAVYRMFGSRAALLDALELPPEPQTRDRILEAALGLVGRRGLADLSMDEVADAAGVSRASLYRLFPGKPALFRELLLAFSPMRPLVETLERLDGQPPGVVMPELARTVMRVLAGRAGVLKMLFFEVSSFTPDAQEAADYVLGSFVPAVTGYLAGQVAAGRLRPLHPALALQSFAGPLLMHVLTRELAERSMGLELPSEDAATELAQTWLRAMAPAQE